MEIRLGSGEGPMVQSPSRCIQDFAQQTMTRQRDWAEQLLKTPDDFAHIEPEIDQHFRNGAGHFVAAVVGSRPSMPPMLVGQRHFRRPYKHEAQASVQVTSKPTRSRVAKK
jgi:hypothetical protein